MVEVLIAFYYGVTGVTCAWAYRKVAFQRVGFFFTGVLFPLLGGIGLLLVGAKVIQVAGWSGAYPDIITLLVGIPLVIVTKPGSTERHRSLAATALNGLG